MCLSLRGSAETALGNYESALEHLLAARAIMDRSAVEFAWVWRMPLESALTELWHAKGDLNPTTTAGRKLSEDRIGDRGTHLAGAGLGTECPRSDGGT
jgi:hypothetical protein